MNWKLILLLSVSGILMSVVSVFLLPSAFEVYAWIVVFAVCSWFVQKHAAGKYFWHGFFIALIDAVWVTGGHIIWLSQYLAFHKEQAEQFAQISAAKNITIPQIMAITGVIYGLLSGIFSGLVCNIAAKVFRKI